MATCEITVNATAAHVMDVLADLPGMLEWSRRRLGGSHRARPGGPADPCPLAGKIRTAA